MSTTTRRLARRGPFSLRASTRFLEGFTPAAYRGGGADGGADGGDAPLRLAFGVDRTEDVAIASVVQERDGSVVATIDGDQPDAVARQLERILSLDVDGTGFPDVGLRDPVIGALQERYDGLRPVCFHSAYEAACWAVIGHRTRIVVAAAVKERIADTFGERRTIDGVTLSAFPTPTVLAKVAEQLPLPVVKRERLHGLAVATLDGRLDARRLRDLEPEAALEDLRTLAGIGPFSAVLILGRGCGAPDLFAKTEDRLHATMRELYDAPDAEYAQLLRTAEPWRPYRSWASVLLRTYREDTTGEIAGKGRARGYRRTAD